MTKQIHLSLGLSLALLLVSVPEIWAQSEARTHQIIDQVRQVKSVQQALNLDDNHRIEVSYRETYGTVILIEALVTLDKGDTKFMEGLLEQGRYRVLFETNDEGKMILSRPKDLGELKLPNGEPVQEYIKFTIGVPGHLDFE